MAKKKKSSKTSLVEAQQSSLEEQPLINAESTLPADVASHSPKYKEDINAFSVPVEDGKDFISSVPCEVLHEILSYVVMDHEPDRAARFHQDPVNFTPTPRVLLSLSAMSRHLRDNVEDFCRRYMIKYTDIHNFKTTAELEEAKGLRRRSERLKAKPARDTRCYRKELVTRLEIRCFRCNAFTCRSAILANGVGCCQSCETKLFPDQINLSDAMYQYDLRDWMLIPSRQPGPRAKQTNLPVINYGTVRTGHSYMTGMCMSYKFLRKDVAMLAKAVHGDVEAHMKQKRQQRQERKIKRGKEERRKILLAYHKSCVPATEEPERDDSLDDPHTKRASQLFDLESNEDDDPESAAVIERYHQDRVKHYQDPNRDEADDSDVEEYGLNEADDIHLRICTEEECEMCWDIRMRKYAPWWW